MKLRKFKLDPVNYQNHVDESEFDKKLAGAIHVETYTERSIGCGDEKTLVVFAFYPEDKDNHTEEYWKRRCELAEAFIEESPDDPDVTKKQWSAYLAWQDFKNSAKAGIEPEN